MVSRCQGRVGTYKAAPHLTSEEEEQRSRMWSVVGPPFRSQHSGPEFLLAPHGHSSHYLFLFLNFQLTPRDDIPIDARQSSCLFIFQNPPLHSGAWLAQRRTSTCRRSLPLSCFTVNFAIFLDLWDSSPPGCLRTIRMVFGHFPIPFCHYKMLYFFSY